MGVACPNIAGVKAQTGHLVQAVLDAAAKIEARFAGAAQRIRLAKLGEAGFCFIGWVEPHAAAAGGNIRTQLAISFAEIPNWIQRNGMVPSTETGLERNQRWVSGKRKQVNVVHAVRISSFQAKMRSDCAPDAESAQASFIQFHAGWFVLVVS